VDYLYTLDQQRRVRASRPARDPGTRT